jgi:hypothetical protein
MLDSLVFISLLFSCYFFLISIHLSVSISVLHFILFLFNFFFLLLPDLIFNFIFNLLYSGYFFNSCFFIFLIIQFIFFPLYCSFHFYYLTFLEFFFLLLSLFFMIFCVVDEGGSVVTEYGFTYIFVFSHGFSFIFPILSLFYSLLWFYYSSTQLCIYKTIYIATLDQEINFSLGGVFHLRPRLAANHYL